MTSSFSRRALLARHRHDDLNMRGAFLHMAADALVSAGVVVAGGLALWFGWSWLDPAASLLIAAVIVWGTWSLFRQSLHLLFDGVPEGLDLHAVQSLLQGLPGVAQVHDLHVWAMGTWDSGDGFHWALQRDIPIVAKAAFGEDFKAAVRAALESTEFTTSPARACFYANQVLRVVPRQEQCARSQ